MKQLSITMPNLYSGFGQQIVLKRCPLNERESEELRERIDKLLARLGDINVPAVNEYGHITGASRVWAPRFGISGVIKAWGHLETMRLANYPAAWSASPRDAEGLLILNAHSYRTTIERAERHIWQKLLVWLDVFLQDPQPTSFLEDMLIRSAHARMVMSRVTSRSATARSA